MFTEITSFCRGAPGAAIVGHRVEHVLRDVGTQGGGENLKSAPRRDGSGEFETRASWRCSLKGKRQRGLGLSSPKDHPNLNYFSLVLLSVVTRLCCSCLWVCIQLILSGPCYPVTLKFCGCKFPIFQPSYYNLCVLSLCCQVLLEILVICKDLFKAVLSEAWKKFSHNLPSWIHNKHLYHLLNS